MQRRFKTDLRCGACVAKLAPVLDADPAVKRWDADVAHPDKLLTVEGDRIDPAHVAALLGGVGYRVLGEAAAPLSLSLAPEPPPAAAEPPRSYFPLVLLVLYLAGAVAAGEWAAGGPVWHRAMGRFMAGFFLAFSFFKLLDLHAFAASYRMYDLLAARSRVWAYAYPFVELGLGLAYLTGVAPLGTNAVTLLVMLLGTAGVVQSLRRGRTVRCACLGAVFNLPMSYVTLAEDVLMAAMAAAMLAG